MNWLVFRTSGCLRQHRLLLSLFLIPLFLTMGCKNQWQSSSTQDAAAAHAAEGGTFAVASGESPTDIAKAALQAIQAKDKATLRKLVALKKVKMDVEAITQGRSTFQGMLDKAISTAIASSLPMIRCVCGMLWGMMTVRIQIRQDKPPNRWRSYSSVSLPSE